MLKGPLGDYCSGPVREMVVWNTVAHVHIAALGKAM